MQVALTIVSSPHAGGFSFELDALASAATVVNSQLLSKGPSVTALDCLLEADDLPAVRQAADEIFRNTPVDYCVQPVIGRRKRVLIADMDSTIINVECLDELADFAGKKAQVAAITERAMRGELQFEGALRERVGMLRGLPLTSLQRVYDERIRLNPGARVLVRTMAMSGARCLLVSGGFNFFTKRVAEDAGFHDHQANKLSYVDDALDGFVVDPILGREAKLSALELEAASLGIPLSATLAVGDGANDLAMIQAAGLGVAYRAKPIVAAQAHAKVDHADLTALLYFQGYRADEFVID